MTWLRGKMLPSVSQNLLLILFFWVLFNYGTIWEITSQERRLPRRKRKGSSPSPAAPKPFSSLTKKPACQACEQEQDQSKNVLETHGTLFFGRRQAVPMLLLVIAALMEGMGIRAVGRVFGLDPNTVQSWLVAAAEQLSTFASHFLVDLEPQQVQLDEIYAPLAHLLESEPRLIEVNHRSSWLWTAMEPVTKLLLVIVVGERSLVVAQAVVHQVKQRLGVDCLPIFLTDGLAHYKTAILTHFGHWVQPASATAETPPKPRWVPLPNLLYAQVIKQVRGGRLVRVKQRIIFGGREHLKAKLEQWGWQIRLIRPLWSD